MSTPGVAKRPGVRALIVGGTLFVLGLIVVIGVAVAAASNPGAANGAAFIGFVGGVLLIPGGFITALVGFIVFMTGRH